MVTQKVPNLVQMRAVNLVLSLGQMMAVNLVLSLVQLMAESLASQMVTQKAPNVVHQTAIFPACLSAAVGKLVESQASSAGTSVLLDIACTKFNRCGAMGWGTC